mgnify:CR=1 FL=1
MKHILIHKYNPDDENSHLIAGGIIYFDEKSQNYDPETKSFKEKEPSPKIMYVDVDDSVDIDYGYIATQNSSGEWVFTKP